MDKERLKRYRLLKKELAQIKRLLSQHESTMYSPKSSNLNSVASGHRSGGADMPIINKVSKHMELENMYIQKIEEIEAELLYIENAIDTLNPTERMVVRYHYIDGYHWDVVAEKMSFGERSIHRYHSSALRKLRQL